MWQSFTFRWFLLFHRGPTTFHLFLTFESGWLQVALRSCSFLVESLKPSELLLLNPQCCHVVFKQLCFLTRVVLSVMMTRGMIDVSREFFRCPDRIAGYWCKPLMHRTAGCLTFLKTGLTVLNFKCLHTACAKLISAYIGHIKGVHIFNYYQSIIYWFYACCDIMTGEIWRGNISFWCNAARKRHLMT